MRRARLLGCVLFCAASFWVLSPRPAQALCECPVATPDERTERSTYVFNGDVWDVALEKPNGRRVITFDVTETFKGDTPGRLEVRDDEEGKECATDFHEGEAYLVYARWRWGATLTSRCWGTKRLEQVGPEAQSLGPSDHAKARYYDKLRILCMGRQDTSCCLASLKAMRKGGFLPEPEKGCPEEMIPDRLRCAGSYVWCVPPTDATRHNQR